jgi:nitrogen fixation/metabolism regulation signal transduction histidine kinase
MQQRTSFEGKFLSKLSKIDRRDIESFLSHLVSEKNFLEVIFNAMVDGVLVLRPNLEVMYSNNRALELLNLTSRRRIVGERLTDLVDSREFADLVARFALRREQARAEVELATSPPRFVSVSLIPLEADTGQGAGSVVVILRDITEARLLEEQRRRAERAIAFSTLSAGLAHEIKNPLNSLMIHAQLLQRTLKDKRGRKQMDMARVEQSADIVLEEIRRLSGVVDQFLSAVRPTQPLTRAANINTLVDRVVATMRAEADERGIRIEMVQDHDIPAAEVDPNQITMAILNLLRNAFEALEGVPAPKVTVRTAMMDGSFAITVADNGAGIAEEDRSRILEPYFTTKARGTGLGLAIVSRIVDEHGGRMDIFSKAGEGTAVTLLFPTAGRPVRLLGDGAEAQA